MAPVRAENDGFRVRVLRSNIANPCKSRAFPAPSGRSTKITCEHLRRVARLECCPLKVVHGDIGTQALMQHTKNGPKSPIPIVVGNFRHAQPSSRVAD